MINLEKDYFDMKERYARQKKDHNLPISEPPSPLIIQQDSSMDDSSFDTGVESKTPSKRLRIASNERTPIRPRFVRSQSVDFQSTLNTGDEMAEDNDDAMSTCSEPPSSKKRKRRGNDLSTSRLPAVDEEGDNDAGTSFQGKKQSPGIK
ncbi:unnamed protein product [Rotaria magnacalcarata]|uniref:Uncharacterized protein n=1 Tax=Rotaria magnacalcarata TaxID=392030 RepID=A0A8S3IAX1_9BILA|nr:unnamed protein product [Rotaria magnacalcarata]